MHLVNEHGRGLRVAARKLLRPDRLALVDTLGIDLRDRLLLTSSLRRPPER